MNRQAVRFIVCALAAPAVGSGAVLAQDAAPSLSIGAHAIGLLTRATSTPEGRTLTEAYLTQPIVSADASAGWFQAKGMLNLEGLTLRRGELDLGEWGEGYVDRRHPHAYLHELMLGAATGEQRGSFLCRSGIVPRTDGAVMPTSYQTYRYLSMG